MRTICTMIWLLSAFLDTPASQAQETMIYRSEYGLIAKIVRVGSQTAFGFELDNGICKGKHVVATVRGPSLGLADSNVAIFVLCDGEVTKKSDYIAPLRVILPNQKMSQWVVHIEFYEKTPNSKTPNIHLLQLKKTEEETLNDIYEKASNLTGGNSRKQKKKH